MGKAPARIVANHLMFKADILLPMFKSLGNGRTVTQFAIEADHVHRERIEFEVVVTKIGPTRMPRTVAGLPGGGDAQRSADRAVGLPAAARPHGATHG